MKKALYFFGAFLAIVGGLGSLGYLLAAKEWVIAAGVVLVCIAAVPTIKKWIDYLING